jgi:pimeloyl-ACP methyl ester carboxylesterase
MASIYKSAEGELLVRERYLECLKHWPVANQQIRVPTREGETFVVACGEESAPPLLLFHGSAGNAAMWMGDVAAWAADFRVYAVDMIGEPGLSAPSRPPLASEAHALWLDDVMRGLSLARVSMVGISLGGWLALDYATRRPERIERLVLLCPSGVGRQKTGIFFKAILLRTLGGWGRRKLKEIVLGGAPAAGASPAVRYFADFVSLIHANFRPRMVKIPAFSDDSLRRLAMPVMAILGGKDVFLDSAGTRSRLERNVAQVDVQYLPEAGHFLPHRTTTVLGFLSGAKTI